MKPTSQSDYTKRIERVIAAVAASLEQEQALPSTAALAGIANFSPFDFMRVYRALAGESLGATVKHANALRAYLAPLRRTEWVVHAKKPFAGPQQVLTYLARYTHRVAIANSRLLDLDATHVRFAGRTIRERSSPEQSHAPRRGRVHAPLPAPRPPDRLPSHPPLRSVRQRSPGRQARTLRQARNVAYRRLIAPTIMTTA